MDKTALILFLVSGGDPRLILKIMQKETCVQEIDCLMKSLLEAKREIIKTEDLRARIYVLSEKREPDGED